MKRATQFVTLLFALIWPVTSFTQTTTPYTTTWNGIVRQYSVTLPPTLPVNPTLVICLHGTENGTQTVALAAATTSCSIGMAWAGGQQAAMGYILVTPIATWKANTAKNANGSGYAFWQAYCTDSYFPVPPDDSGFIRSLIQQLQAQYSISPGRTFVTGMSSGAMMAYRVAIDSSDLIAAVAVVSCRVAMGACPSLPNPAQPVSVLELSGDADATIPYCGGTFSGWGEYRIAVSSVDADMNYLTAAYGLPANQNALCGVNGATATTSLDFKGNGIEVQFVRELGLGHSYRAWATGMAWEFFSTHGRQ